MNETFRSLMLGHKGDEVDSAVELAKASGTLDELHEIVQAIPSIREVVRQALSVAMSRLSNGIDIDKVYINRGKASSGMGLRPTGTLSEVLLYCLEFHVLPGYVQGDDGVYYVPDTLDEKFKVHGLGIIAVEEAITKVLLSLENHLKSALDKHWSSSAVTAGGALSNKNALQENLTQVLMAELSLSVMTDVLKEPEALRVAELMEADTPTFFAIKTGATHAAVNSLGSSFVVDRSFLSLSEIKPSPDLFGWILYTPNSGYEYFQSSLQMHETLCSRFSLGANEVTYPLLSKSVFSHYVDACLREQRAAIGDLVTAREKKQQDWLPNLVSNQKLNVLWGSANARYATLKAAIKRREWPEWLKKAGDNVQQRYLELEHSKENYELQYQSEFERLFSLNNYVLRRFEEWAMNSLGEKLNPDKIKVCSLYNIRVGERTIEQKDTRTLTEFLLTGLHDAAKRAELTIEGAPAGSLLRGSLEHWLNNRDLRVEFVSSLPPAAPATFQVALADCLHSRMEYALFVARNRGIYQDSEVELIQRGMAGDPRVLIKGVNIDRRHSTPLKDVLVFLLPNTRAYYVCLKTPENNFEFLKFVDDWTFIKWFQETLSRDRRFAESIIRPSELDDSAVLGAHFNGELGYHYKLSYTHGELGLDVQQPLMRYVDFLYSFEVLLLSAVAPLGYCQAGIGLRQSFARLDTELRALATVEARENTFPSFETYTRDLIKNRLQAVLKMKGEDADIDPDRIIVQTDDFTKDLTSVLVEELTFAAPHPAYQVPGSNPKFYLKSGHPAVSKLDIRDLAHLSVTLHPDDNYTQMLKDDYRTLDTAAYKFKRAVHAKKIRCEMHRAVLFEFFNGRINLQTLPAFQRVIDGLAESTDSKYSAQRISEIEGIFSLVLLNSRVVEGVYIFRLKINAGFHDYLYTPNAPDQKSFRPIQEFVGSIRHRAGPFREYYIKRVLIEDQKVVNDYFDKLQATVDTLKPLQPSGMYRVVDLYGFHYYKVERALRNIDERTTSFKEFIGGLIYDSLMLTAGLVALFVPPVGVAITAVTMLKSAHSAAEAYRRGDYSGAIWHGKDMLVALIGLGKAAALAQTGSKVVTPQLTRAQQSLFSTVNDAWVVTDWVAKAMGQDSGKEFLLEYIKGVMAEHPVNSSETTVR
ncbi:hypothetical protein [Pseudomonas sp. LT1P18]|uniref:hypothetical protein n=1 Tax=Pseudomonas arabinosi TaxID=3398357 RepID=UPI0039F14380